MARQLASIKVINDVRAIPNADVICQYRVDGWWVVDKKDKYNVGDTVVYFEIDSWLPHELAPFITPKGHEPKEYNGVIGNVLKTVKLRGKTSQGLIMSISDVIQYKPFSSYHIGMDLTEYLGIQKYEPPISLAEADLAGVFPSYVSKTDQTRVQSLCIEYDQWLEQGLEFEITEKLDGQSVSFILNNDEFIICSRNYSLKVGDNPQSYIVSQYELESKMRTLGKNLAVQGELIGQKIQGNPYHVSSYDFFVFDVFDIDNQCYLNNNDRLEVVQRLGLKHVPVIDVAVLKPIVIDDLLVEAEGKSQLNTNTEREGLVYKCTTDPSVSFKVISNKSLLKKV